MLAIIDYGIGNIRSVRNALDHLGIPAIISHDPAELRRADALLLPGVGAFGEGMARIEAHGLRPLLDEAHADGKPLLGICLGFELLMLSSDEMGRHDGLGYVSCPVSRLPVQAKLPHIGWSRVETGATSPQPCRLLQGLEGESFYFVHSYGVHGDMGGEVHATASYGGLSLMALVEKGNVFGTQFHPEKSGEAGLELLRNFSRLC